MTIWNRGPQDVLTTIKILCDAHVSDEGCGNGIVRDREICQASENGTTQPKMDASGQLSLMQPKPPAGFADEPNLLL